MSVIIPPTSLKKPELQFGYLHRMLCLLREQHNATTAAMRAAGKTLAEIRAFQKEWQSRNVRVHEALCAVRAKIPALAIPYEQVAGEPPLLAMKRAASTMTTHDALILADPVMTPGPPQVAVELDPTEDFTTYTEVDPNSHISKVAATITVTGMSNDEDAYVYADKGADHFGIAFTHLLETTLTAHGAGSATSGHFWALSNTLDDMWGWYTNKNQACFLRHGYNSGTDAAYILLGETEDPYSQDSDTLAHSVPYYCTIARTGVNGVTLTAYEYTDAARTVLAASQSVTLTASRLYRYVFGCNSTNSGSASSLSYTVSNLDLQEAIDYVRTASEALGVSDTAARLGEFARSIADGEGLTDVSARVADFARAAADSQGLADALTRLADYARTATDAEGITDAAAALAVYVRDLADNCGISDSAGRVLGFVRDVADGENLTDAADRIVAWARSVADAEGLTDVETEVLVSGVKAAVLFILLEQQTRN